MQLELLFSFFFFFEGPPWVWIYLLHFEETSAISLTVSHGNSKKYPLGKKPRMSSGNNNKGVKWPPSGWRPHSGTAFTL